MISYHRPTATASLLFTGGVMLAGFALYVLAAACLLTGVYLFLARIFGWSV